MPHVLTIPIQSRYQDVSDYFLNRSAYCVLPGPVPDPFVAFELALAARFPQGSFPPGDPPVALAENLCRRMATVDFFAHEIGEAIAARDDTSRAWVLNALLVAHFSACKSLLDAGSVALAEVYKLNLPPKEQDFGKGSMWRRLETGHRPVFDRYQPFRAWMTGEVVVWRDAAVHRLAPLVIAGVARNADGKLDADTMRFRFPLDPDMDDARLWAEGGKGVDWGEPLHFHRLWRDRFVAFCSEVCKDIARLL